MPQPHWAGNNPGDSGAGPPGPPGPPGASTLTDLTDVTGAGGAGTSPVDDGTSTFPLTRVTTQDDLTQILTSVAEVDWRPIAYAAGWQDYGQDDHAPGRCRLTLNNVVHLEGLVQYPARQLTSSDAGTKIGGLDQDCLPGARLSFICLGGVAGDELQQVARIDVAADGSIVFQGFVVDLGGAAASTFSLTSISFSVGAASAVVASAALDTVFA
jgi:hypothetical protein